jgi:hypothetical protein
LARIWSGDGDAAGLKPHGESCRIGQALEQRRKNGPFRDETPAIGRDPGQQVSVADDETDAVINSDRPGIPKGVTHPADRGGSTGEAETLGQSFSGVDRLPKHAERGRGRHDPTVKQSENSPNPRPLDWRWQLLLRNAVAQAPASEALARNRHGAVPEQGSDAPDRMYQSRRAP